MRLRWFAVCAVGVSALQAQKVDFQREIRPVLSDNCFQCHGPDAGTRMAGLRLDLKDGLLGSGVIVAGKPAESKLYQRISATEDARRMPPAASHKALTAAQIGRLKLWIEQGAPWVEHWAYTAPVKAELPVVKNPLWAKNPIDRFVLAKLDAAGLTPAPGADKRTLIRRVALDLTGLPPTPAELDLFLKDLTPKAYENMIDRYLASPHYGEHRARYWLDAARYGDTHGIHIDNYREIWPYRDWVIQALNRNVPYDRFSTEQLAGDLLPNATLDQKIATGFMRCGVTTNEAGLIEDEYAEIYAKDRAETASAVFLGLTTGCATCHNHKFDPLTQKDFYSLGAFFRNTTQKVMDDNVPDTPPVVVVPKPDDREAWAKTQSRLAGVRAEMAQTAREAEGAFTSWLSERKKVRAESPLEAKAQVLAADVAALAKESKTADLIASNVAGRQALHFQKNEGVEIKDAPKLDSEKPFTIAVSFFFPKAEQSYVVAAHTNPKEKNRGWSLEIGARVAALRLIGDSGKSIDVRAAHLEQLQPGTWNTIVATYDGSRRQAGLGMYQNGRSIPTQGRGNVIQDLAGDIGVDAPLVLGKNLPDGAIADLRIFNREVSESEAQLISAWPSISAALENGGGSAEARASLLQWYLAREYAPMQKLVAEQNRLNAEAKLIARRGAVSLVMQERTDSKPHAWILYRGAYDQRREEVEAGTPAILPPMTSSMPRNRLGLAQWLFTDEHPLTSRVAVNRMWQEIFGIGLSKTTEDFGSQGEPPTHKELLDWLAVDFREHGWDMKRFYKQILMSATYRQMAAATPLKLEKDPENRLLSRGVRFRLDGEMVRDYALAATGLLSPQIGGPSVKPYQPEGVWEAVAMDGSNTRNYKRDAGDGLYRRTMYTFWKRSAPPASMEIFNAPSRENCTVRRERTDTPLQALVTMNDVQFVEAAREVAGRAMQTSADFDTQLEYITTRLLARPLGLKEKVIAKKSFGNFKTYYASHESDAQKFLSQGERKADPSLPQANYAALTMLTNQMLNLDEVLNK
ncbi:MAG: Protein of unknown function (DUF1553)/Protein of unknown function (DUF1549)/Planctomycete [Bryobacterales bacterium]|nr:Protein of unknown function (DUF1553)/Protein of unknown function (DUF1549)/Planctomycete [Bryobacterales bacterium]